MDKLTFPLGWAEGYNARIQQESVPDVTMGPDLLHKHKVPEAPGILTQTVELITTAQEGEPQ